MGLLATAAGARVELLTHAFPPSRAACECSLTSPGQLAGSSPPSPRRSPSLWTFSHSGFPAIFVCKARCWLVMIMRISRIMLLIGSIDWLSIWNFRKFVTGLMSLFCS